MRKPVIDHVGYCRFHHQSTNGRAWWSGYWPLPSWSTATAWRIGGRWQSDLIIAGYDWLTCWQCMFPKRNRWHWDRNSKFSVFVSRRICFRFVNQYSWAGSAALFNNFKLAVPKYDLQRSRTFVRNFACNLDSQLTFFMNVSPWRVTLPRSLQCRL